MSLCLQKALVPQGKYLTFASHLQLRRCAVVPHLQASHMPLSSYTEEDILVCILQHVSPKTRLDVARHVCKMWQGICDWLNDIDVASALLVKEILCASQVWWNESHEMNVYTDMTHGSTDVHSCRTSTSTVHMHMHVKHRLGTVQSLTLFDDATAALSDVALIMSSVKALTLCGVQPGTLARHAPSSLASSLRALTTLRVLFTTPSNTLVHEALMAVGHHLHSLNDLCIKHEENGEDPAVRKGARTACPFRCASYTQSRLQTHRSIRKLEISDCAFHGTIDTVLRNLPPHLLQLRLCNIFPDASIAFNRMIWPPSLRSVAF